MSLEKEKIKITPRMFRPKVIYTITINPEEQHEKQNNRVDRVIRDTRRKLDKLCLQYNVYAECSSPLSPVKHKFPRIHFHGIILFENYSQISKWYNEDYFKLSELGYFEIDTLGCIQKWHQYCTKEQDIMKHLTKESHIKSLRLDFKNPLPSGNELESIKTILKNKNDSQML